MADQESSKRQVAYKVRIADILNNRYVKEDGWMPNYIAVGDRKVSRANIIGVIVSKGTQGADSGSFDFVFDDGTGRIALRFSELGRDINVGDIVNVIGRPREFGSERYVVPEAMKKVTSAGWVEVRQLEIALSRQSGAAQQHSELNVETEELAGEEIPNVTMLGLIRKLDSGSGVEFQEISVKFKAGDAEEHIRRLLEQGDIFEVKPGRYKVLE
ncbi:hypothetical protein KY363_01405 [Candidatus Woesearchaeota archaeon]|nr:hypothetical protein [Candidatus Woesearchaeota archaeon]